MDKKEIFKLIDKEESFSEYFKYHFGVIIIIVLYGMNAWLEGTSTFFTCTLLVIMTVSASKKSQNERLKTVISKLIDDMVYRDNTEKSDKKAGQEK